MFAAVIAMTRVPPVPDAAAGVDDAGAPAVDFEPPPPHAVSPAPSSARAARGRSTKRLQFEVDGVTVMCSSIDFALARQRQRGRNSGVQHGSTLPWWSPRGGLPDA